MSRDGHEVALRGWANQPFIKIHRERLSPLMDQASRAIEEAVNIRPKVVRPPNGQTNAQITELMRSQFNLTTVLWSVDARDGEGPSDDSPETVKRIVTSVLGKVNPGDVVMFHCSSAASVAALPSIVDALQNQGYELLTLSEVLSFPDDKPH